MHPWPDRSNSQTFGYPANARLTLAGPRRGNEPPSRGLRLLPLTVLLLDALSLAVAVVCAGIGRSQLSLLPEVPGDYGPSLLLAGPLVMAGWIALIAVCGGYDSAVLGAGADEYRRVLNASFISIAVVGICCYLLRFPLSRGFFLLVVLFGMTTLLASRMALRAVVKSMRERGALLHRVLIVGTESHVDEVAAVLDREAWLGYDVVGALTPHARDGETAWGVPVLGCAADVSATVESSNADVVFFAGGAVSSGAKLRKMAWELEQSPAQVMIAPSLTDVSRERVSIRPVGGLPLLHLEKPRAVDASRWAKRTFDVMVALLLLVALLPVIAFTAFEIWRFDRGPIFFRQHRVGRHGQPFRCWKFRTMVVDAEARRAAVLAAQGVDNGLFAKLKEDPRITNPGRWLRRLSLDELPQLFNVLRGEMSLVGPRPQTAHEVSLYDDVMARRLHVRPGMTGLWQVSGRSDLSVAEAVRLDLYYVDNWSMVQDLHILARTFGAVVGSRGAY